MRPTTHRFDALVLGSTLGAVVAGAYLARAGLRVALFEERLQAERPPLLREPFLLTGLEPRGPIDRVLIELGVGAYERQRIVREEVSLQVLLTDARLDLGRGCEPVARDLEIQEVCDFDSALPWLQSLEARGAAQREAVSYDRAIRREAGWSRTPQTPQGARFESPPPPPGLQMAMNALRTALCPVEPGSLAQAPLTLGPLLGQGAFRMDHAGHPFSDLFRQRLLAFNGEIRTLDRFTVRSEHGETLVDDGRQRLFAPILVVGAPRAPLRRFLEETDRAPGWLEGTPEPLQVPLGLARSERQALPSGMASHLVEADRPALRWIARSTDPNDPSIEWAVLRGPGAEKTPAREPLGSLSPFARDRSVGIDPGPGPRWDLDGVGLRFLSPHATEVLERDPLVVAAGPEIAPDLGLEGEICGARRMALRVLLALGS